MDPKLALNIDPKVKIIHILLNQFFDEYQSLKGNEKNQVLLNLIDEEIDRSVAYLNTFLDMLVKKLNVASQSIVNSVQQSAYLKMEELEYCPSFQNIKTGQKSKQSKFISRDKRGPYRSYTRDQKNYVVFLNESGMNFASISKKLGIPQKNVVRWCRDGLIDGDSNKRLADSDMEKTLWLWIQNHPKKQTLNFSDIQAKALQISSNSQFKASRGWMKNFFKRFDSPNRRIFTLEN